MKYLLMALLVLCWGTQFKASLYQLASHCKPVPNAKLLSEAERSDAPATVALQAPDIHTPPAIPVSHGMPASLFALPQQALAIATPFDPPHPNWRLLAQMDALGHFFHRPPPTV